jgi:hypothetical protein
MAVIIADSKGQRRRFALLSLLVHDLHPVAPAFGYSAIEIGDRTCLLPVTLTGAGPLRLCPGPGPGKGGRRDRGHVARVGQNAGDPAGEGVCCCRGDMAQQNPIQAGAERAERRPVDTVQPQDGGTVTGGTDGQVGVEHRKEVPGSAGRFPAEHDRRGVPVAGRLPYLNPDQLGHAPGRSDRYQGDAMLKVGRPGCGIQQAAGV